MSIDTRSQWAVGFRGWVLTGCLLVSAGCSDDSGDGGEGGRGTSAGETTFSCEKAGKYCIEYKGSASRIDTIRDATKCVEQGAVEGTGCTPSGAACALPANGSTGTSGVQYYYAFEESDMPSLETICKNAGGTFSRR